jgi:17beta-estradiol 17-dehydrogenase / very-long-chain 3-oxoacyl-CoA reductase
VPTKTVIADAADAAGLHAAVGRVAAASAFVDLGIVINNIGMSHDMPVAFAETDPAEIDAIVQTVSF